MKEIALFVISWQQAELMDVSIDISESSLAVI